MKKHDTNERSDIKYITTTKITNTISFFLHHIKIAQQIILYPINQKHKE